MKHALGVYNAVINPGVYDAVINPGVYNAVIRARKNKIDK